MTDSSNVTPRNQLVVSGSGGSSSKGSTGSGSASSTPDTLFSTSVIRLVGLVGEGPIGGVVGGLRGVYRNKVPVINADGTYNFKGITAEFREGYPDQPYMAGYPDVETEVSVGTVVTHEVPVVAALSDPDFDRVRVLLFFPTLLMSKTDGSVRAYPVSYKIELRYYNGPWISQGDFTLSGKTQAGYYRQHEFSLPTNPSGASAPWQVRVTRITADDDKANASQSKFAVQSTFQFYSVTGIIDSKLTYPHSAVVGISAQTSQLGDSLGNFTLLVDGIIIPVPSNRDRVTRSYSGIWDGTFKYEVCDNPAWLLHSLLQNDTYGLGEYIDESVIDKWALYEIGRYCDVLVSDGAGGTEPRFTFNGQITEAQEAYDLLQLVSQAFRGMTYWGSGSVTASQDSPTDYTILATEANVLADGFKYSSSARKARHTVAIVAWHDPSDFYAENLEYVVDGPGVALYGYNPTKIDLLGCTSRGQAHRAGLWTLLTELYETQVVTYRAGLDHAYVRPGDVVAVQDPSVSGLDISGRLLRGSTRFVLYLDRHLALSSAQHEVSVLLPTGKVEVRVISGGSVTADGKPFINLAVPLSIDPAPNGVWQISGDVVAQKFRVVNVHEVEPHIFEITGLQYEPTKFAAVDDGVPLVPDVVSTLPNKVEPPTNLKATTSNYMEVGVPKQALTLSWLPGSLFNSVAYHVTIIRPGGDVLNLPRTASTSIDVLDVSSGDYTFVVVAVGVNGSLSLPTQLKYTVLGWDSIDGPKITNLQVVGGGKSFSGRSCSIEWQVEWPENTARYTTSFVVRVFEVDTNVFLSDWEVPVTNFTYTYEENVTDGGPRRRFWLQVTARDIQGREGKPASIVVQNPPPEVIDPEITTTTESIFISYAVPTDPDFQGVLVWQSRTSGFNPLTTRPVYDGQNSLVNLPADKEVFYYIRIAGYDVFSKTGLNISPEKRVFVTNKIIDTDSPEIPTGLTLTTSTETSETGVTTAAVTATWDKALAKNFGHYSIEIREGPYNPGTPEAADGWLPYPIDVSPTYTWHNLKPGLTYSVRVRAWNSSGFAVSGFSQVATIVAALNLTPPGPATNVAVLAAFESATLTWRNPTDKDLSHAEVWSGKSPDLSSASRVASVRAPTVFYVDVTLPTGGTRYYWVRPVNTSGTAALTYAGPAQASSAQIKIDQIAAGAVDATKFVRGIEPVGVWEQNFLPPIQGWVGPRTILWTSDNKLYRYTTQGWTAAVPSSDVTGQLQSAQIASIEAVKIAGQVTSTQIADNSISTPKLQAGSVTAGIVAAGSISADSIVSGAVTTSKLAAQSITSDKFTSNSIGAGIIQAGAISSDQLQARGISADRLIAGSISATEIGSEAVFANHIKARTIVSDRIAAGNITAVEIAAQTIRGEHIAANSIQADRITLNGSSSLSSWLYGPDTTQINGGSIAANTIRANKLMIGARGIRFVGVEFQVQKDTRNISWTGGSVIYVDDQGNNASSSISGGSVPIGAQGAYVFWNKRNPTVISVGGADAWPGLLADTDIVIVATYDSFAGLAVTYGQTVIDGTKIVTGTITANQIAANQIQASHIAAGAIIAGKIAAGAVTADIIGAGTITAGQINLGSDRFALIASQRRMRIFTPEGWEAVTVGDVSPWVAGSENQSRYGIIIRENSNREVMRISNEGAYINGAYIGAATIGSASIGSAAITNAKIANLEVDSAKIANLTVGMEKITNGAVTQVASSRESGQIASLQLYSRSAASRFVVMGFRRGNAGVRYTINIHPGNIFLEYSTDSVNWGQLEGVPCVSSYQYDQGVQANYTLFQATSLMTRWEPGYVGTLYFRCRDDNAGGVGGTFILVMEIAK